MKVYLISSRFAWTAITELFDTPWVSPVSVQVFALITKPHWNSLRFRWLRCRLGGHIQQQFLWHSASAAAHTEGLVPFGSVAQSLCVRSTSPFPPGTEALKPLTGPRKSDLREVFFGAGAALGKPEESLNFQYWTCCEVGPAPCDFDRRLHTNSCRKQAKTRPSSETFSSSVSSRYQLAAVSNKDTWEQCIFTGCTSLHDGNSVQLGVIFLS